MKTIKILMMAAAVAGLTACSSDNDEIDDIVTQPTKTLRPITIEVTENPFATTGGAKKSPRKAPITYLSTLETFKLNYAYLSGDETQSGNEDWQPTQKDGKWQNGTGKGEIGWPDVDNDKIVDWYAFTDGTFNGSGDKGTRYIEFSADELATGQKDLLVAKQSGTWESTQGNLHFTFDHACSALKFYVKKANNLSNYSLKVNSVKLCNIKGKKCYYFCDNATWNLKEAETSNYTLYDSSKGTLELGNEDYVALNVGSSDSDAEDDYAFVIPQTCPSDAYLEIDCEITGSNGSQKFSGTARIAFSGTFEQGCKHDVKVNIGRNSLKDANGNNIITD